MIGGSIYHGRKVQYTMVGGSIYHGRRFKQYIEPLAKVY
jgi:hypothetical protein